MIIEYFIATILVCSPGAGCGLYADAKGPSDTIEECRVKLDALWQRAIANPKVDEQVGPYSKVQFDHRGFCLNSLAPDKYREIVRYYDL